MTRATTEYPERCLHEVWHELTARGFVIDEPGLPCQCFIHNLRDAQCEMDLLVTGALVWVYVPLAGTCPEQTARLVLALLSDVPASGSPPPARYSGLPLMDAAGQMLADAGMTARPAEIRYDVDEVHTEVVVTNPAGQARGQVRISETGSIHWECFFASPGNPADGLPPRDVAQAITAALAEYRTGGQGGGDSGPDGAAAR